MAIKESALSLITSIAQGDWVRAVTSAGASRRITFANLAKAIVESYTGSSLAGSNQSVKAAIDSLGGKTDLSGDYTNSLGVSPESISIIKKGNVAHISIAYPSVSIANDTQIGVLPSVVKSSGLTIFKVVNRSSGALAAGTGWMSGGASAIRYYGSAISSTRILIEGLVSLDR